MEWSESQARLNWRGKEDAPNYIKAWYLNFKNKISYFIYNYIYLFQEKEWGIMNEKKVKTSKIRFEPFNKVYSVITGVIKEQTWIKGKFPLFTPCILLHWWNFVSELLWLKNPTCVKINSTYISRTYFIIKAKIILTANKCKILNCGI